MKTSFIAVRFVLCAVAVALSNVLGCDDVVNERKGMTGTYAQEILPSNYSNSYYFIDPIYQKFWSPLHEYASINPTPEMQDNQVVQLEIWISTPLYSSGTFKARAYVDLPARPANQRYADTVENPLSKRQGDMYIGRFVRLEAENDFEFPLDGSRQSYGGYIILNSDIPQDRALAVTYTIAGNGKPRAFGTLNGAFHDTTADGNVLLKLIKPPYLSLHPSYKPAWNLQLRNVYPIGNEPLTTKGFSFKVYRRTEANDVDSIMGEDLLQILGLDKYGAFGLRNSDKEFDYIPGVTVNPKRAEIIFRTLRPFDSTIVEYFYRIGKPLKDDSLLFNDVYDTTYTAAQNNFFHGRYFMRVTRKF